MPTQAQVLGLVRAGHSYEEIGRRLAIPPGQAYLIATGLPADGSDALDPARLAGREGLLAGSSQHLANPATDVPTTDPSVLSWIKARAAADAPMRTAAAMRTAEPPPIQGEGDTEDVISVLGWDHNQVKYLEEQLEAIPGVRVGGDRAMQLRRVSIVDMMRVRLSRHEAAEEEYFWPAVRRWLDDGDALAQQASAQEQEGKDLLQALAGVDGDDERFDELVEQLVLALRKHVAFEDTVFLRLSDEVDEGERAEVGRQVLRAKRLAPTRPHPHVPDNATALKMAGAVAAPLDKARDALGQRPAQRKGKATQAAADKAAQMKAEQMKAEQASEEDAPGREETTR